MEQRHNLIDTIVARVFDIDISMLRDKTRKARAAQARFLVFSLRAAQEMDIIQIGNLYNRNKQTIRHGIAQQKNLEKYDKRFRQRCEEVRRLIHIQMLPYDPSLLHVGATVRTRINSSGNTITGTVARITEDFFIVESFEHPSFISKNYIATGRCELAYETSHDIILIVE